MWRFIVLNQDMSIPADSQPCRTYKSAVRRARWMCRTQMMGKAYIMAAKFDGKKLYLDLHTTFRYEF